jgi:hypothetical protein
MNTGSDPEREARDSAERALQAGLVGIDATTRQRGQLLDAVPLQSPNGDLAGWVVGVATPPHLVGIIQLTADGTFHRYASFQRRPGSDEGCPTIDSWFDEATILTNARSLVAPETQLSHPVLTYDQHPDRLVWSVEATSEDDEAQKIYVAGDYVYLPSPPA